MYGSEEEILEVEERIKLLLLRTGSGGHKKRENEGFKRWDIIFILGYLHVQFARTQPGMEKMKCSAEAQQIRERIQERGGV